MLHFLNSTNGPVSLLKTDNPFRIKWTNSFGEQWLIFFTEIMGRSPYWEMCRALFCEQNTFLTLTIQNCFFRTVKENCANFFTDKWPNFLTEKCSFSPRYVLFKLKNVIFPIGTFLGPLKCSVFCHFPHRKSCFAHF